MASPLLGLDGAIGEGVAWHYGNPLSEQRLLDRGEAWVDLGDHEVITLTGPDRLIWLNSICSQELLGFPSGATTEALILDPHGHIEHRFLITDDGQTSWLLTEPGTAESLSAWLVRMRFRMQVDIETVSGQWSVLATTGRAPDGSSPAMWSDPWPDIGPGAVGYGPEPHPGEGLELVYWLHPRDQLSAEIAPSWAGTHALEALLVRAARPTLLGDVDDKTLPHELDWIRTALHLEKGCYRGQETVAKVHNLGHPPRRVVLLHLDGSGAVLPEAGADVSLGDKTVGVITRAVRHYEWGPIALAVIKRNTDPEAQLSVQGPDEHIVASQEVLVAPDAGATRREAIRQVRTGR